ncbi:MAG: glycosyltransferase family 4 protein [Verrucomicrobia bacterium]|nr:glycosyltransferase family 4 protein [Verrucomicrobiota bacterium]
MNQRIGFVSTRFAGLDGVSLESAKWAEVLWDHQHVSHWYAGVLDRSLDVSTCVPEAYFGHPENIWINEQIWGKNHRSSKVTGRIQALTGYLKNTLYEFVQKFDITVLVFENAMTIPMHVPLGIACTEFINESSIPAIAHHHDFYWERPRFSVNAIHDYLDMAFPPRHPGLQHVVINESAREELSWRKGVHSILVPNVLDFETPPLEADPYTEDIRNELGLTPDDIMILQPTRVVPRKGIEHAISLVEMLGDPKYKLVISHEAGDEGMEYLDHIRNMADDAGIDIRFVSTRIGEFRQLDSEGRKVYTLWDLYPHADLVTYPSLYEGFGNAFLEAVYFKVPVLVNRYSIFTRDIEPKGFRVPIMDGILTRKTVEQVRQVLDDPALRQEMVDHNYALAKRFFSYSVLRRSLRTLITNITGLDEL